MRFVKIENNNFKSFVSVYIRAQSAESGPPLGTILGNLGVNAVKFCKEFNEFTSDLPNSFVLPVHIYIFSDKSFSFRVFEPSLNDLLTLLLKEDVNNNVHYIMYDDLIKLAILKFPFLSLQSGLSLVCSVVRSRKLIIYDTI